MFIQMYHEKYMRFPDGKAKALTFSYDDGGKDDARLMRIFDQYHLRATFNLNTERFAAKEWHERMNREQTIALFQNCVHEIAIHGATHLFLNRVPLPEANYELTRCRADLEQMFHRIITGMAYAYNSHNQKVVELLPFVGITYARTTVSTHSFALPENFLLWNPTCHHKDAQLLSLAEQFLQGSPLTQTKQRESWLFYVWGHSFEFEEQDNWQIMETFAPLVAQRDDIWYATNGEIYDYVKAYERLQFSIDGEQVFNPSARSVWVEIRGKTYEIPAGNSVRFDFAPLPQ